MANLLLTFTTFTTITTIFFSFITAGISQNFSTSLCPSTLGLSEPKNLTHFHFYFHDQITGLNPTAIRVVEAQPNTTATAFGTVFMFDNILTVEPEPNSTRVGRAQGMYAGTDLNVMTFMMVYTYVFDDERYNGSSLSILCRNPIFTPEREFPVVGGSGVFRFASGYAKAKTFSTSGLDAVVEYDVYVLHN